MFACFGAGAAEAARSQQAALGEEIAHLTKQIEQLNRKNAALVADLGSKTEQLNVKTEQLGAARLEVQQIAHKAELQTEVNKKALQRQGDVEQLVDQLQKELEEAQSNARALTTKLTQKEKDLAQKDAILAQKDAMLQTKDQQLEDRYKALQAKDQQMQIKDMSLEEAFSQLTQKDNLIQHKDKALDDQGQLIRQRDDQLRQLATAALEYKQRIEKLETTLAKKTKDYDALKEYSVKAKAKIEKLQEDLKKKIWALNRAHEMAATHEMLINKLSNPLYDGSEGEYEMDVQAMLEHMSGGACWGSEGGESAGYQGVSHTTVEVRAHTPNASVTSLPSHNRYSRTSSVGGGKPSAAVGPAAQPTVSEAARGGAPVAASTSPNTSVSTARTSLRTSRIDQLRTSRIQGMQDLRASMADAKAMLQASLRETELTQVLHVPSPLPVGLVDEVPSAEDEEEAQEEEEEEEEDDEVVCSEMGAGAHGGFDAARAMRTRAFSPRTDTSHLDAAVDDEVDDDDDEGDEGEEEEEEEMDEGLCEEGVQLFMRSPASSVGASIGSYGKAAYAMLLQPRALDTSQTLDK